MERTIDQLWTEEFEKFIVMSSALPSQDPCGGGAGKMPAVSGSGSS